MLGLKGLKESEKLVKSFNAVVQAVWGPCVTLPDKKNG